MLERSIESFKAYASAAKPMLADRGIPDTLSYAYLIDLSDKQVIREACEQYRYAPRVFFAPPWREIYHTDEERKQDYAEAVRTAEQIVKTYQECGYEIVELPKTSPEARAEVILQTLLSD